MIIYNSTWSILIPIDKDYIVRLQSDLVNTKASILPVCDKPYHTKKGILQKWEELENLQNYVLKTADNKANVYS